MEYEVISLIFSYLPLIDYQHTGSLNQHFSNIYQKNIFKLFPSIKRCYQLQHTSLSYNHNNTSYYIRTNIYHLSKYYIYLQRLYKILFVPTHLNISSYYKIISKYLKFIFKHNQHNELDICDQKKKYIPYEHYRKFYNLLNFNHLVKYNEYLYKKIHYFIIDGYYYNISDWMKCLIKTKMTKYQRAKQLVEWFIQLVGEHLGKFIYLDDLKQTIKRFNPISPQNRGFKIPKYIHCGGLNKNKKQCKNKIEFQEWRKKGIYKWYCHHHCKKLNNILSPATPLRSGWNIIA